MSTDELMEAWIAHIKAEQIESGVLPCTTMHCASRATRRVFWPAMLVGRPDPTYCDACAHHAKQVLETLGCAYHDEALPPPPGDTRGIAL